MPKYKFLQDCELKQGDGLGQVFKAGEVYILSVDQGERWKRRLMAEDYVDPNAGPSRFDESLAKPAPPHAEKFGAHLADVERVAEQVSSVAVASDMPASEQTDKQEADEEAAEWVTDQPASIRKKK